MKKALSPLRPPHLGRATELLPTPPSPPPSFTRPISTSPSSKPPPISPTSSPKRPRPTSSMRRIPSMSSWRSSTPVGANPRWPRHLRRIHRVLHPTLPQKEVRHRPRNKRVTIQDIYKKRIVRTNGRAGLSLCHELLQRHGVRLRSNGKCHANPASRTNNRSMLPMGLVVRPYRFGDERLG